MSHPNLGPDINSVIDAVNNGDIDTVDVREIPDGYEIEIETRNTVYRITNGKAIRALDGSRPDGEFHGCNFGGSMYMPHRAWVGGYAEFYAPSTGTKKITTCIQRMDVVKLDA